MVPTRKEFICMLCNEVYGAYDRHHCSTPIGMIQKEEIRMTDPITGGQKGVKPARYALIPPHSLEQVAKVYGYGANKYEEDNWRKGYPWRWSLDALHRHIAAFEKGESIDGESNLPHLAHATFHLLTLMEFERLSLGTDDRLL